MEVERCTISGHSYNKIRCYLDGSPEISHNRFLDSHVDTVKNLKVKRNPHLNDRSHSCSILITVLHYRGYKITGGRILCFYLHISKSYINNFMVL